MDAQFLVKGDVAQVMVAMPMVGAVTVSVEQFTQPDGRPELRVKVGKTEVVVAEAVGPGQFGLRLGEEFKAELAAATKGGKGAGAVKRARKVKATAKKKARR